MPYLLLKTLISLHCGNPSKNLSSQFSYFEVFKSIFSLCLQLAIAYGGRLRHRSKEKMGNTLGKSGERRGVMLEFENLNMTNLLNW
ncbi:MULTISPECIES: hypothetical protein [unclassified Nostoc]|uniref:hypothetical protein n=1 Tax=unclassified Nostoc TaxID=2593658 RepID=UPI000B9526E3|nr:MULTISPECIES: hypothetical protein [unclassified Nostoc]OYD97359.1 hypothetical protein CDG76_00175 [Nostoc sp. 'Peltigera membranacea cyanobiont' 210A]PHM07301.1 hypothetical protein CK516_27880 [Nostoc sp. 'Peltigera malacea cyanobiont' DB3992]